MSAAVMPTALENRRHSSTTSNSSNNNNCKRVMYERQLHLATSCVSQISNWEHSSRHRNLSGPSSTGRTRPTVDSGGRTLTTPPPGFTGSSSVMDGQSLAVVSTKDSRHRNLDRSHSDSSEQDRINGNPRGVINSSRYKTELCRPFEENGHCKYGDKCQFAHGMHELRNLSRHPKYKTERCRTYHTIGFCPYGPRCHFIHNDEERAQSKGRQQAISASSGRPRNLSGLSSIGSSFESMSTSSNSPGNLSPVLPAEDQFPSITTFSVSDVTPQNSTPTPSSSSPRRPNGSIFNFPASDANHVSNSPFVPLGVQTDQFFNNVHDLQMLYQDQRYSVQANVNINANIILQEKQQRQQQQDPIWFSDNKLQEELDFLLFPIPSSSPVSSDSMGSSSSLDEVSSVIASNPLDVGRSMRLPIFNQLT